MKPINPVIVWLFGIYFKKRLRISKKVLIETISSWAGQILYGEFIMINKMIIKIIEGRNWYDRFFKIILELFIVNILNLNYSLLIIFDKYKYL